MKKNNSDDFHYLDLKNNGNDLRLDLRLTFPLFPTSNSPKIPPKIEIGSREFKNKNGDQIKTPKFPKRTIIQSKLNKEDKKEIVQIGSKTTEANNKSKIFDSNTTSHINNELLIPDTIIQIGSKITEANNKSKISDSNTTSHINNKFFRQNEIKALPCPVQNKNLQSKKINQNKNNFSKQNQKKEREHQSSNKTLTILLIITNILITIGILLYFLPIRYHNFSFNQGKDYNKEKINEDNNLPININDYQKQQKSRINTLTETSESIKDIKNIPSGLFYYGNEDFFAAFLKEGLREKISDVFPEFKFIYLSSTEDNKTSTDSIMLLLEGKIDFLLLKRPLAFYEYNRAKLNNLKLKETSVAKDSIIFFTNQNLSISDINLADIVSIFEGQLKNWKQLGGEDLPIIPTIGSKEEIESLGLKIGDNVNYLSGFSESESIQKIIDTPGALGYIRASLLQDRVFYQEKINLLNFLTISKSKPDSKTTDYFPPLIGEKVPNIMILENETYPITQELNIVWVDNRDRSRNSAQAIIDMILTPEGQKIVEKAGFVRINKVKEYKRIYSRSTSQDEIVK